MVRLCLVAFHGLLLRAWLTVREGIDPLHAALEIVGHVCEFRSVIAEGGFVVDKISTGDETGIRPLANIIRTLQVTRGREKERSKAGSSDRTFVYPYDNRMCYFDTLILGVCPRILEIAISRH